MEEIIFEKENDGQLNDGFHVETSKYASTLRFNTDYNGHTLNHKEVKELITALNNWLEAV